MNPGSLKQAQRTAPQLPSDELVPGLAVREKGSTLYQIGIIAAAVLLVMSAAIL